MKNYLLKVLITVSLLLILFPQVMVASNKVKTILFFFSLNSSLPAYQNIMDGFHASFAEDNNEPCNLLIEYLDITRSKDDSYARSIIEMYNEKFKDTKIDLLISVGPGTMPLLKKYSLKALNSAPAISIENEDLVPKPSQVPRNKMMLEIILRHKIDKTIQNAFSLFPKCKNAYVISGSNNVDQYYESLFRKQASGLSSRYNFNYISGISLDSTIQFVAKIPRNCVVFVPVFLSDKKNIPFSTPEALTIISFACNSPVFPIFDSFIKRKGILGGYVFSFKKVGEVIGNAARQILKGEQPGDIIINEDSFYQYIYDWQMLKKWKLENSGMIPSDSIFYNKDPDFFREHKWYILGGLFFLFFETFLIIYLIRLISRQKGIAKKKEEIETLYRSVVREERLQLMSELTASLSHELNQPLTAILYNAQAGRRFLHTGKLDEVQADEIFRNIIEDDKRAGSLISSVRNLMKFETRGMENVNLKMLIEESLVIFYSEANNHHIKIRQYIGANPVFIFGDKIQIQQVVLNLMSNAAIAMENNDPEMKVMTIIQQIVKETVTVSVRDTGPGISPEMKENLFKPFVTTRKKGFGIGLALSHSIIEKHNGKIWAENHEGGGAEFFFSLKII
jgi:signal transduction histidine kinase